MWNILKRLNGHLVAAIPSMMLMGFIAGLLTDTGFLRVVIVPLTFLMVYPMMVTLRVKKVLEGGDARAQILGQLINFAVIPFVAFALGRIFFPGREAMALGLLLAALLPTSGMTISWTGFARGNLEAAVKMTVAGLILGSIATPFYVNGLMGAKVAVETGATIRQIALIVFLPMIAGYLTQRYLVARFGQSRFQQVWAPRFPGLSTLGVLGIVFIAVALKAREIAAHPGELLLIVLPLVLLYTVNYLLSTTVGRMMLPRGDAIALVYGTVMRNLSIALAVAMNVFGSAGSDAALVIAVAYIIQVQSAAWYVRFTDRIFGEPPAAPA